LEATKLNNKTNIPIAISPRTQRCIEHLSFVRMPRLALASSAIFGLSKNISLLYRGYHRKEGHAAILSICSTDCRMQAS